MGGTEFQSPLDNKDSGKSLHLHTEMRLREGRVKSLAPESQKTGSNKVFVAVTQRFRLNFSTCFFV